MTEPLTVEELGAIQRANLPLSLEKEREAYCLYLPKDSGGEKLIKRLIAAARKGMSEQPPRDTKPLRESHESVLARPAPDTPDGMKCVWMCRIGGARCGTASDAPLREAVATAFVQATGQLHTFMLAGWEDVHPPTPEASPDQEDVADSVSRRADLNCEPSGNPERVFSHGLKPQPSPDLVDVEDVAENLRGSIDWPMKALSAFLFCEGQEKWAEAVEETIAEMAQAAQALKTMGEERTDKALAWDKLAEKNDGITALRKHVERLEETLRHVRTANEDSDEIAIEAYCKTALGGG